MAEFVFAAKTDDIPAGRRQDHQSGREEDCAVQRGWSVLCHRRYLSPQGRSSGRGRAGRLRRDLPMAWLEVRCPKRRNDHEPGRSRELLPNPRRFRRRAGLLLRLSSTPPTEFTIRQDWCCHAAAFKPQSHRHDQANGSPMLFKWARSSASSLPSETDCTEGTFAPDGRDWIQPVARSICASTSATKASAEAAIRRERGS